MPPSAFSDVFMCDEQTAKLLVEKCFAPSVIEQAFNLRSCEGAKDSWCYGRVGEAGIVATLPRSYAGNVQVVGQAVKNMAKALNMPPMYMLVTLVSGAACINTQRKIAEKSGA